MLKKMLLNILRPFKKIFLFIIYNSYGIYFVIFFNMYSFLLGLNGRISKKDDFFLIEDETSSYKFKHRKQGLMAYADGLFNRGQTIAREYLIDKISFFENDIIIDCGANNGDLHLYFRDKKITYIGIEPSPIEFSNLEHNVKDSLLINKALYKNSSLELDFYVSSEYGDSSLIKITDYSEIIKVKSITLDEILDKYKKIKLIKLEAEGAEPEILEGLVKSINKVEYISIDVGLERGVNKESTLVQCTNYLIKKDFDLIGFNHTRFVILFKNNKYQN